MSKILNTLSIKISHVFCRNRFYSGLSILNTFAYTNVPAVRLLFIDMLDLPNSRIQARYSSLNSSTVITCSLLRCIILWQLAHRHTRSVSGLTSATPCIFFPHRPVTNLIDQISHVWVRKEDCPVVCLISQAPSVLPYCIDTDKN